MTIWNLVLNLEKGVFNEDLLDKSPIILSEEIKIRSIQVKQGIIYPPIEFRKGGYTLTVFPRDDRSISRITLSGGERHPFFICSNNVDGEKIIVTA